jgi:ankyrin repeat protein
MSLERLSIPLALACSFLVAGCRFGMTSTPLGNAAARGDLAAITSLLDAGASPNEGGRFQLTPLAVAARVGRVDAIELLLKRGADPHLGSGVNGWTPLLHALHKGQLAAAKRLAATCQAPSTELNDALYMAAGYAQTDAVRDLLARGADPEARHGRDGNALTIATSGAFDIDYAFSGCGPHTETVRALLEADPGLKLEGDAGAAARKAAESRGCSEMLVALAGR